VPITHTLVAPQSASTQHAGAGRLGKHSLPVQTVPAGQAWGALHGEASDAARSRADTAEHRRSSPRAVSNEQLHAVLSADG
jgi:hypothetical protein